MIKTIEFEFKPTPEELAEELLEMDCGKQADFLCEVARELRFSNSLFLTQLQYVADEINKEEDFYGKVSIVRMLETVLEYVKGEGD